jgi:polyisoprenoid-binding protein YceI
MSTIEATETIPAGTWQSDATHSSIGFSVLYNGVAPFRGAFRRFAATLDDDGLVGSAGVDSITTEDENLTGHLLSPEFFDSERNPELRFVSSALRREGDRVVVSGELTLKGVTREVELRGTIAGPVDDAYGNARIGLNLETTIDRTQFGINWNAQLPSGGKALADEVKLSAELQLVKAAER